MANPRATKSGLSREAHEKMQAKYSNDLEVKLRGFFEEQLKEALQPVELGKESFRSALKDGVKLCELMNKIQPGAIRSISKTSMVFKQMENISKFNVALKAYGVEETSTFQTGDLIDGQDMATVQNAIWQLVCQFRKKGGTTKYGIKLSEQNKRDFDEETLRQGQSVIGLQMGSNKGATQAGMNIGAQRKL